MLIQPNYFKRTTSDVRTHYSVFKEQWIGEKRSIADSPFAVKHREPAGSYEQPDLSSGYRLLGFEAGQA